jgi:exonuclease III
MLPGETRANAPDAAFAVARDLAVDRFLLAGDWNMSPQLWDHNYGGTRGAKFFRRIAEAGWVDCYRRFHADEGRTWFRKGNRAYQFDHAFCDGQTAKTLRSCDIDSYAAEVLGLSDHAPLVVELEMPVSGLAAANPPVPR